TRGGEGLGVRGGGAAAEGEGRHGIGRADLRAGAALSAGDDKESPLPHRRRLQYKNCTDQLPAPRRRKGQAMDRAERERRHEANVERINQMELVVGRGDRLRIDHEGTLLERARLLSEELRSHQATELGLAAL